MIINVYNIKQSWIFTQENKPSKQLFETILSNSTKSSCNAQFIEHPTSFTIKIRLSDVDVFSYNWNLVSLDDQVFYTVQNVEILQLQKQTIINIDAQIDLYLSYICNLFDETNSSTIPVFFKQKHLNRWMYFDNGNVVNFAAQFYLKNKHPNLNDIGINLQKATDTYYSLNYNNSMSTNYSTPLITTLDNGSAYCYALCKLWKGGEAISSPTTAFIPYFSYEQLPNSVLINITTSWTMWNNSEVITNQQISTQTELYPKLGIPWWYWFTNIGNDAYDDFILLPTPIENAYVNSNNGLIPIITPGSNLWDGTGYFTQASNVCNLSTSNTIWYNFMCWTINPQQLFYFINQDNQSYNLCNVGSNFANIFNNEPYLIQYCKYRVRASGEDCFVDLTFFNNVTPQNIVNTLESFTINMNHPVTQITNIKWDVLAQTSFQTSQLSPYGYNNINDVLFSINWKAIYPSWSTNWNNYLLNNLNQYHTALNIAHYGLQQSQANVAFNALGGFGSMISGLFDGKLFSPGFNTAGDLTGSIFGELTQQQEYNYLKTGKQQDMSRVSNQRLATNNNAISYNDYLIAFIFEYPVVYEQNLVVNYCILNGYILDRWLPFSYWLNRKYCNYVKICYFADTLLSDLIVSYKKAIDEIMNAGVRIWSNASLADGITSPTLNLSNVLYPNYSNVELNQNNNEIVELQSE